MGKRVTGKLRTKVELEVGASLYAMSALSTVTSPASDIRKKYLTSATYISDDVDRQATVRLDGQISGFTITPGSGYNEVDVSTGSGYLKGVEITVNATTITDIQRPTLSATNVLWTALSVDTNGTINKTVGTEGGSSSTRGAAGGPPYIPIDEFLIGYVTATYYTGSSSGAKAIVVAEINSGTKEYASIPNSKVVYHDGSGTDSQDVGVILFASQLDEIHSDDGGTNVSTRNVYAQYHDVLWEEAPDAYDFNLATPVATVVSQSYDDDAEQKSVGVESWSASGNGYTDHSPNDFWNLLNAKKRWYREFPDKNKTGFYAGLAVVSVTSRNFPVNEVYNAAITIDGSGKLYPKLS
jgi:hypothetical protein